MFKRTIYFVVYLLAWPFSMWAEVMTYKADRLEGEVIDGKPCKQLAGHVVFTFHDGMVLTTDQAYKYDDQERIEAEGNVTIVDPKGNVIKSGRLTYDLAQKQAVFVSDVSYASTKATFYTAKLIYDVAKQQGKFLQGGKLVQDQMVLTSNMGLYDGAHHRVTFSGKVVLEDLDYSLHCDQLHYHTESEIAYFKGNTKIIHQDGVVTTTIGGSYLLPQKRLVFHQGTLTTADVVLTADRLEIAHEQACVATGHVSLHAQKHDAVIVGAKASYAQKEKKGTITGHPLLTKGTDHATMYLGADAFMVVEKDIKNKPSEQEIHALGHVKLYQEEVQGVADGAVYNSSTHTIHLHHAPVIWCSNYQITGEEVSLVIKEGEEMQLLVDKHLFVASADPVGHYNQVKGHKMAACFKGGVMQQMSITGNSESLYFALGDKNELVGMNHIKCDCMEITVRDHALEQMICTPSPRGLFYPAEKIEEAPMQLDGFVWHGEKWPTKENILQVPANHG